MAKKSKADLARLRPRRTIKPPPVKKIALPVGHVAHVEVPAGHVPVVAVDPEKRVVQIAHVPLKKSWWEKLWE